jgi:peptidyl-prolyl cis-trans isomerase D
MDLAIQTTHLFSKDKGNANDISNSAKVREVAFSNDVLNDNNNSEVISLTPDRFVVLRIQTHTQPHQLTLDEVKPQIVEELTKQKAIISAQQTAEAIKEKLQQGAASLDLKAYPFSWNKLGYIGRYSPKIDNAILDRAFTMPVMSNQANYQVAKLANAYAVVAVYGIKEAKPDAQLNQQSIMADQMQMSEGMAEYKLYQKSILAQAKITVE